MSCSKNYLWSIVWFLCLEKNLNLPYSVSGSLAMSAMAISTNFYFWDSSASVVHQRVPMKGSNYFLSWGQGRRSLATWQSQPRPKSFNVMWPMDSATLHYYHGHNNIHIGIEISLSRLLHTNHVCWSWNAIDQHWSCQFEPLVTITHGGPAKLLWPLEKLSVTVCMSGLSWNTFEREFM
jgi:hypothetical protein